MKAIRVAKRGKQSERDGLTTVYLLVDPERTLCGRKPAELDVIDTFELETLPALDGCGHCRRTGEGWTPAPVTWGGGHAGVTLEPSSGSLRKTGSLGHGTVRRRGTRIR